MKYKHIWKVLSPRVSRCKMCGLDRTRWPFLGLWRPWPFNHCTGYYD